MTFANASYWPALLALGIPILLHLLNRRTRRIAPLPTLRFLHRTLARQSPVFRLHRWLLLALRFFLLLCLILAFLRPQLESPLVFIPKNGRARVIVVDISLSMRYNRNGISTFENARSQALSLLKELTSDDTAAVLFAGRLVRSPLPDLSGDFSALEAAVRAARPTEERGNLTPAITLAASLLRTAPVSERELILLSDFQRTDPSSLRPDSLPEDVRVVCLSTEEKERENTAITDLRLRPENPRPGDTGEILVDVWNGTPGTQTLPVTLKTPNETQQAPLTLSAYSTNTVTFPVMFSRTGRTPITVQIPLDALPEDNTRRLVADIGRPQNILLLTDSDLRFRNGAFYLNRALNPTPERPGGLHVLVRRENRLASSDLRDCVGVVTIGLHSLSQASSSLLASYLRNGGTVLTFVTASSELLSIETLIKSEKSDVSTLFSRITNIDSLKATQSFRRIVTNPEISPLLRPFEENGGRELGEVKFQRTLSAEKPLTGTRLLLAFEDGRPAAVLCPVNTGRWIVCGFSPDPQTSDLAKSPMFPPLIQELLREGRGQKGKQEEASPNTPIYLPVDPAVIQGKITAVNEDGGTAKGTASVADGRILLADVEKSGFYSVRANRREIGMVAVNPDPSESDLRSRDLTAVQKVFLEKGKKVTILTGSNALRGAGELSRPRPLWHYFLMAALLFHLLELFVNTFGSQARGRSPRSRSGFSRLPWFRQRSEQ